MKVCLYRKYFGSFLFALLLVLHVSAQDHAYRFIETDDLSIENDVLVGRIGSHFFLLNTKITDKLLLKILDTATGQLLVKDYDFSKDLLSIRVGEQSLLLIAALHKGTDHFFQTLEIDKNGNIVSSNKGPLPGLKGPVKSVTSKDKAYVLFYEMARKSADSSQIRGVLLGPGWLFKKQLQYAFQYEKDLESEPVLLLDDKGNTHIMVYDQFDNYRISSNLTLNSISFEEELIISETFTFEKVKFKSLQIFQNQECACLQVEGMYVDGITKINKGIYSIAFPPGRKNELAPRFIPFGEDLIKSFKKGFSATAESIVKSIQLQDILYADEGSILVLRINNGLPQKIQNQQIENDPSLGSFNKALGVSRGADYQPPPIVIATTAGTTGNNQRQVTVRIPTDKYTNAPPMLTKGPTKHSQLSSRSSGRNAPKFIGIRISKDKGILWYNSKSLDIFDLDDNIYNRLYFIHGEKEALPFILYQADLKDEPAPVFMTMKSGKILQDWFPEKKILFSPLLFLDEQQYAGVYFHLETGRSGIMVIKTNQ